MSLEPSIPIRPAPLDRDEIVAHASFVRGVARGLLADVAAADDLAQETLLKLLRARPARPASLKAWLVRVVKNLAIQWKLADVRRSGRETASVRREAMAAPEAAEATDALVQRMELHRRVVELTLELEEGARTVLLLHYFDGLSMPEIAQRLGVPLETVRTRLKRALERLRARLEPEAGGRQHLLRALLPVAGFELPSATLTVSAGAAGATAGGALVAAGLATTLGAPLFMTTAGKLSVAAAPLLVLTAWWLVQEPVLDDLHPAASPRIEASALAPVPQAVDDVARADAEREVQPVPTAAEVVPAVDGAPAIDPRLAAAGLGTVRVHVVGQADRRSAANVGVRVAPEAEPRSIRNAVRGCTDADGTFVATRVRAGWCVASIAGFDPSPRWRWAHPDSLGAGEASRSETPDGDRAVAFKLAPGATRQVELCILDVLRIDGLVVDAGDRPVAGASIWISDCESTAIYGEGGQLIGESTSSGVNGQVVATSDAQGRFDLRSVQPMTRIAAFAPGYALSPSHLLFSVHDPRHALTIRLTRPGRAITGRVVDGAGKPVADAMVSIDLLDPFERKVEAGVLLQEPVPRRERSDADGRFVIEGAPLAPLLLIAQAAGFAPGTRSFTPAAAAVEDCVLALETGGTLAGTARDEAGAPVAGFEITVVPDDYRLLTNLDAMTTRSDDQGRFRIEHLLDGPLHAAIGDARRGRAATSFTVHSGQTQEWNAILSRGRLLRGRVVDERGAPLVDWPVSAAPIEPGAANGRARGPEVVAKSDGEGRFELANCSDLDYEISARDPGAAGFSLGVNAIARPDGGEVLLQVRDAQLAKSWIFGSLRAPEGFSVSDALLCVTQQGGGGSVATHVGVSVGPKGFQSGPYPAGWYRLELTMSKLPARDLGLRELKPGEELDLGEIVFERPARIVVHARHADGSAVEPKELRIVRRDTTDHVEVRRVGSDLEADLVEPGGCYYLCCDPASAHALWQPFECVAGERVELTVTLEPAALRLFRFVPRAGAAGAKTRVTVRCLDEAGAEVWVQRIDPDAQGQLTLRTRFGIGKWTLEATAGDGTSAEFDVDVPSLQDDATPREVPLH